jgi:hypothetical protein
MSITWSGKGKLVICSSASYFVSLLSVFLKQNFIGRNSHICFCDSRYHIFPVQHEIRRRVEDYKLAISKIRRMSEPYLCENNNACDGINYWELADNFNWETDFKMSTFTRNFAARMIQRQFLIFKSSLMERRHDID